MPLAVAVAHDPANARADREVELVVDLAPALAGLEHGEDLGRRLAARLSEGEDADRAAGADLAGKVPDLGGGRGDPGVLEPAYDPRDLVG